MSPKIRIVWQIDDANEACKKQLKVEIKRKSRSNWLQAWKVGCDAKKAKCQLNRMEEDVSGLR